RELDSHIGERRSKVILQLNAAGAYTAGLLGVGGVLLRAHAVALRADTAPCAPSCRSPPAVDHHLLLPGLAHCHRQHELALELSSESAQSKKPGHAARAFT